MQAEGFSFTVLCTAVLLGVAHVIQVLTRRSSTIKHLERTSSSNTLLSASTHGHTSFKKTKTNPQTIANTISRRTPMGRALYRVSQCRVGLPAFQGSSEISGSTCVALWHVKLSLAHSECCSTSAERVRHRDLQTFRLESGA